MTREEQKHIDYISSIRKELLSIENNAKDIDGLTESQWVAIRAAHRLLGEYIEKEQEPINLHDKIEELCSKYPINKYSMSDEELSAYHQGIHLGATKIAEYLSEQKIHRMSEEDEDMRDTIIRDLKHLGGDMVNVSPAYKAEIDWLKSLSIRCSK